MESRVPAAERKPGLSFELYARSIAANWWLILLIACLSAALGFVLARVTPTEYRSRASLAIAPGPQLEDSRLQLDSLLSMRSQLTTTLTKFVTSGAVLASAGDGAYVDDLDRDELELTAHEIPNSVIVEINVRGDDEETVVGFITDVMAETTERFQESYEIATVETLDPSPLVAPARPSPGRRSAVAGTIGLAVGFLLGLVRDVVSRTR